jgi:hypothetical protein
LPACEKFVIDPSMRNLSLTEGAEVGVCTGVVGTLWGVRDFLIDKYRFCPPENVTVLDATKVLIAFHTSRSKRPQLDDVRLEALLAFKSKWPCK